MYESVIDKICGEIRTKMIENDEKNILLQVEQSLGYCVDKNELIKALQYDRDQYNKGYQDAKRETQWIPVTDRLPNKEYDKLLVVIPSTIEGELYYDFCGYALNLHEVDEFDFPTEKPGFFNYDRDLGFYEEKHVIAWKEIEPYEIS